ncbi:hypothetical protein M426DRAFT_15793 [Hypoxylon sp. CI-4A]|nr:hypothetical protein M426DRAFT_15793 [Hypoxylon sp. CI-4A]
MEALIDLVYTSNYIELTGSNLDVTTKLCCKIFKNEKVAARIEPESTEYTQARDALASLGRPNSFDDVIRSRREIINHAQAIMYAIDNVIWRRIPIDESLLKAVHKRLCLGDVLEEDAGRPCGYRQYRTWEIAVQHGRDMKEKSFFVRASTVARYMSDLARDLQEDMYRASKGEIDNPYDMACRYSHRFFCIHPFGDGNGKMCRIILNILLLLYTRTISTFGGTDDEREEYLDITRRGNDAFRKEDMEVEEEEKLGHEELRRLTSRKSRPVAPGTRVRFRYGDETERSRHGLYI